MENSLADNEADRREEPCLQPLHKQCPSKHAAKDLCLAQRYQMGHRAVLRRDQDRAGDGSVRGEKVYRMEPPYVDVYAGSFFSLAFENKIGGEAPAITLSQLRILLEVVLPLRTFDVDKALELVRWIQYRNHLAYQSHRKRKIEEMAC